jgi:V/A-type H+-transporting ATPase subunit I
MRAIDDVISEYTLRELAPPRGEGTVADELETLGRELEAAETREREIRNEAVELAKRMTSKAGIALAWWESERTRILQEAYMVGSDAVFAARGFIRANHFDGFKARLEKAFPGAELERLAIKEADDPPVSVTWNSFFRPAGLLVKMFGLPHYRSIDPTAFLTLSFFTFFGICYGDLLYGVMLILVARWLKKRFSDQRGLVEFFRLFTYAGVSTVFFGIVTGSWGADLPKYFGEGNPVDTLRLRLTLLDPLAKPMAALAIAIGIGIVNQLYGIFMRFLRDYQRGDTASSVFDGILWLAYLGGLLTLSFGLAASAPKPVVYAAGGVLAVAALGLVLTQGRAEKNWLARLLIGLISLYGIMGTYGTTAFIGDVISYSRLMALGLTTTVVGMSFNIIAGMVKGIPYIGWLFFIIVLVFGHLFNFIMSILSAFVHSARLILLEWFSRFYEGGGVPFRPYGFQSSRLELLEN